MFLRWKVAAKNFRFNKWEKFFDRKDPPNKLFTLLKKLGCLQYCENFFCENTHYTSPTLVKILVSLLIIHLEIPCCVLPCTHAACQWRKSQRSVTSQKPDVFCKNNQFFHTYLNHLLNDINLNVTTKEATSLKATVWSTDCPETCLGGFQQVSGK